MITISRQAVGPMDIFVVKSFTKYPLRFMIKVDLISHRSVVKVQCSSLRSDLKKSNFPKFVK